MFRSRLLTASSVSVSQISLLPYEHRDTSFPGRMQISGVYSVPQALAVVLFTLFFIHAVVSLTHSQSQAHADTVQSDARSLCPSCLCNICSSWCTSAREKPTPPLPPQRVRTVEGRGVEGKGAVRVEEEEGGWTEVKTEAGRRRRRKHKKGD